MPPGPELKKFFEILAKIIHSGGSWQEKRKALLADADLDDQSNLEEFAGWFEREGE